MSARLHDLFNILSTTALVICALVITFLLLRHEFAPTGRSLAPSYLDRWRTLVTQGHMVGDTSAEVYIIEFFDYECPYCEEMEPVLGKILEEYHGRVALVRFDLPLPSHVHSMGAAIAAACAAREGRYGQYHSLLFDRQEYVRRAEWLSLAVMAGVSDTVAFRSCINGSDSRKIIENEIDLARQSRVQGTPTFVVNGHVRVGAVDGGTLKMLIEQSLNETKK